MIIGGASSGKSDILVRDMVERSISHPDEKFFAVVPEQATLTMQKKVVDALNGGATFNIDVVSFDRLAQVVFSDMGIDAENILDDTGKIIVLKDVLKECADDLQVYGKKVRMSGFIQKVKSSIAEIKQYDIDDNMLYQMQTEAQNAGNSLLYAKLQDIRLILGRFNEEIADRYRAREEVLSLFASIVKDSRRMRASHIYLDGFTGFTPVQYKLIKELLKFASDITVTLTLPEDKINKNTKEHELFHLSCETYFKLRERAVDAGTEIREDIVSSGDSSRSASQTYIYAAPSRREEVVFTAKEILRLVRDEQMRFREIAVIAADMEKYHGIVEDIFEEAGIPCFIDHRSSVSENPLSRYVLSALRLIDRRFSYDSVFSFLKTGLTEISPDDISYMENYCLEFGIKGRRAWFSEMEKNRRLYHKEISEDESEDEPYKNMAWDLGRINSIRESFISGIEDFAKAVSAKSINIKTIANALKALLAGNETEQRIADMAADFEKENDLRSQREYAQIFGIISELIDKTLILSGEDDVTVSEYCELLKSAIDEASVSIIPPSMDMLTVGDITRTRLENVKLLFLLGADADNIPASSDNTGMINASERQFLKDNSFVLAPGGLENIYTQQFYLYMLFHKPDRYLYISYPLTDEGREELRPAYILESLEELAGIAGSEYISKMPDIKWHKQAARELALNIRNTTDDKILEYFASADPLLIMRMAGGAFYTNAKTPLDKQVALDLYGGALYGSVSRYERFNECPFKHFLNYGLKLEKRREYKVEAADMGNIYHNSLERYSRMLEEEGYTFRNVPDDKSREIAKACVEEVIREMPSDVLESSERNAFLLKRLTEVTLKTTDILREHIRAGLFDPDAFELEFKTDISDRIKFNGKIDRVDIYDSDDLFVKIIDYKSGNKEFDIADIFSGVQLQLVAYLSEAIAEYKKENPDRNVRPGGVYYYHINDSFSSSEEEADKRFMLKGLTSCEADIPEAVDSSLAEGNGESRIVKIKLKKDGTMTDSSDIANEREFEALMSFARGKITEASEKILEGDIAIEPYFEQERKNACIYCDYKNICRFEDGTFDTEWKKRSDMTKAQMEDIIYGRIQPE